MKQTREKGNKPHVVDGRSVDREMASQRAIVKPTLLFFFSLFIFFEIFGLGIVKILIGTEILTFLCPPRIVGGIF